MAKHLRFSAFDMAGITTTVRRYRKAGLKPEYNADDKERGIVSIRFKNPHGTGSFVYFKIHKLARPGWLGEKAHWVIQLCSQDGVDIEPRGCVTASTQARAIRKAEIDLKYNFLSVATFEFAADA